MRHFLGSWGLLSSCVLKQPLCKHRKVKSSGVSFYEGSNPIKQVLPLWPHLTLISSQRPHLQMSSYWAWGFEHMLLGGGGTNIQSITFCLWTSKIHVSSHAKYIHSIPMDPRVLSLSSSHPKSKSYLSIISSQIWGRCKMQFILRQNSSPAVNLWTCETTQVMCFQNTSNNHKIDILMPKKRRKSSWFLSKSKV